MSSLSSGSPAIPPEAIAALSTGNKIEAIKILRNKTGLDLKAAKELIEHYERTGGSIAHTGNVSTFDNASFPSEAVAALNAGNKLEAIRIIREKTGMGLKDSKDRVEDYIDHTPALKSALDAAHAASMQQFLKWTVALIALAGACAYFIAGK